jgi:DNA-directed RNA polymerase specialized sigma24 family protein
MENTTIRLTTGKNSEIYVEFDRSALKQASKTVQKVLVDDPEAEEIPVLSATSTETLVCIKGFLLRQQQLPQKPQEEQEELPHVTNPLFMEVLRVANYLEIDSIIDHCTRLILQEVQGKSAAEIQKIFGVQISEADKEEARRILDEE